jgi:hypothetical protein
MNATSAEHKTSDYCEIVTWRRLSDSAAIRYICLQDLNTGSYAVAVADFFSDPRSSDAVPFDRRLAEQLAAAIGKFEWCSTLKDAMDVHDAGI